MSKPYDLAACGNVQLLPATAFALIFMLIGSFIHIAQDAARERAKLNQPGPCVVHAAEECAKHADAKILMVRYNEVAEGHAYCVFRDGRYTYAWDWRGTTLIDPPDAATDAMSVAAWLTVIDPPLPHLTVRSAAYEWSSK